MANFHYIIVRTESSSAGMLSAQVQAHQRQKSSDDSAGGLFHLFGAA